jgi:hypothetical protein
MPHEEQRSEAAVFGRQLKLRRRRPGSSRASALRLAAAPGAAPAPAEFALDRVQRWLQAVIVHPGDVEEAIACEGASRELAPEALTSLVRPSHSLTAAERVDIYHGMYLLRMVEALEADYPALRHFLGEEAFAELVEDYVQAYPSRSYTLNRLGDHLPQFLLDRRTHPHAGLLHELARLELAITEVFDAEEAPVLTPEQVRAIPPERWPEARLRPIAAFRLLTFSYPVVRWLDAARRDRTAPAPVRKASRVVVYRQRFSVLRLELSRPEFTLLEALASGAPLGEAVALAGVAIREKRREDEIFKAFRSWIAEGMFSSIDL